MIEFDEEKKLEDKAATCMDEVIARLNCWDTNTLLEFFGFLGVDGAAGWFVNWLMLPQSKSERPLKISRADGKATGWYTPYNLRVLSCLGFWGRLSRSDRDYIKEAREEGIYWRGEYWTEDDPLKQFRDIAKETSKMKEFGKVEYVNSVRQTLKIMFRG